jgi:expansin (peptidoglycan-binding protein)
MGGSLGRQMRHNDNSTGKTIMEHKVPTLTLAGTKDGLYRISRNSESYWHHVQNVDRKYAGKFPVVVLEGHNHASFFDSKYNNAFVKANDLQSNVP